MDVGHRNTREGQSSPSHVLTPPMRLHGEQGPKRLHPASPWMGLSLCGGDCDGRKRHLSGSSAPYSWHFNTSGRWWIGRSGFSLGPWLIPSKQLDTWPPLLPPPIPGPRCCHRYPAPVAATSDTRPLLPCHFRYPSARPLILGTDDCASSATDWCLSDR